LLDVHVLNFNSSLEGCEKGKFPTELNTEHFLFRTVIPCQVTGKIWWKYLLHKLLSVLIIWLQDIIIVRYDMVNIWFTTADQNLTADKILELGEGGTISFRETFFFFSELVNYCLFGKKKFVRFKYINRSKFNCKSQKWKILKNKLKKALKISQRHHRFSVGAEKLSVCYWRFAGFERCSILYNNM